MFHFMVEDAKCLKHRNDGCSEPGVWLGVGQHPIQGLSVLEATLPSMGDMWPLPKTQA